MFPPSRPSSNRKKHDDYYIIPIGAADDSTNSRTSGRRNANTAPESYRQFFLGEADRPPAYNPDAVPPVKELKRSESVPVGRPTQAATVNPIGGTSNTKDANVAPVGKGPDAGKLGELTVEGIGSTKTQNTKNEDPTLYNQNKKWFGMFYFGKTKIYVLNSVAVFLHFALLIGVGLSSQGKSTKLWRLKQDRTYASPVSQAGTRPFVQVNSRTCNVARPNYLNFTGGSTGDSATTGRIVMWTYAEDAGVDVDIRFWVLAFFLLSFLFQGFIMLPGKTGYGEIFHDWEDDDVPFQAYWSEKIKDDWYERMLYFNWLRFVEYSISGTDVLIIIAIVAGIVDYELLLAMVALSFSCMILGLIAEWSLRVHTVLYHRAVSDAKDGLHPLSSTMKRATKYCFWTAHLLAWVCIIIPWQIILQHYQSWYHQCGSDTKPPEWLIYVVALEAMLFALFGIVQLLQWWWPYKRRAAEVAYIALSISAKAILGLLISFNVLMQD